MKVEMEKSFPMPAAADIAWSFLQDIPGMAGCMPGAKITERIDDKHYKGTVTVKVGPVSMSFRGEIEVMESDAPRRTLHLLGKGSDTSGSSGASMDLVARIDPGSAEWTSILIGRSEVTMSGKAAAFGGRMMGTVADQILNQFAGNFAVQVLARAQAGKASMAGSGAAAGSAGADVATNTMAVSTTSEGAHAAGASNAPARELNALALFWAALRDWFRSLFRRNAA